MFSRVNVQKAFVGAAGFALDSGLSDATEEEAQIKRAMVDAAQRGDRHRRPHEMGPHGLRDVLPTDEITAVLSDTGAPSELVETIRARASMSGR